MVVGWTGREYRFRVALSQAKQEYQVAIGYLELPDGRFQFVCGARPRLGLAPVGGDRAQQLVSQMTAGLGAALAS